MDEDVLKFREIIQQLKTYKSVGTHHPKDFFEENDDECSNHCPDKIYLWNHTNSPRDSQDLNGCLYEDEDIMIFFDLTEGETSEGGTFYSKKMWLGVCDFQGGTFEYDSKLQAWKFGDPSYLSYFKFT